MKAYSFMFAATIVAVVVVFAPLDTLADDVNKKAKAQFYEGTKLFKAQKYQEAVTAFRKAMLLRPSWKIYYNVGHCEAAMKNYGRALDAFEAYLGEGGDDVPKNRRNEVLKEIEGMSGIVGYLEIEAQVGTRIFVDGMDRGVAPLSGRIRVSVGSEHEIRGETDEGEPILRKVKVGSGEKLSVNLGAGEKPGVNWDTPEEAAGEAVPRTDSTRRQGALKKKVGWISVGVGSAAIIVGIVTGGLALSFNNDIKDNCEGGKCGPSMHDKVDKTKSLALATDILLPVGSVAAVAGILLLTVFKEKSESADVSVAPLAGPHTLGAAVEWRF